MSWLLVLVAVATAYQLVVILTLVLAWRNPRVPPRRTPAELGIAFEEVRFPTAHGRTLHGWWIAAGDGAPRPVVILVHGWGRNAERMLPYVAMLHPRGHHLLAFDARHHGLSDSDGHASMLKFSQDIRAAIDFAVGQPGVDPRRIAVLGLSVGGSAAIHAAAHDQRVRAVITAGAFADPRDAMVTLGRRAVLAKLGLPLAYRFMEWRIGARFADIAPAAVIGRASARMLIVHGDADAVVPVHHAHRLAAAANGRAALWVMPGRGHSDVHVEAGFAGRVEGFLRDSIEWPETRPASAAAAGVGMPS